MFVWIRLIPNMLRAFVRLYVGRVTPNRQVGPERLLDRMQGYNSTATRGDMRVVLQAQDESIINLLREGCFVETELVVFRLSVKKEFGMTPSDHPVVVTVTPTEKLTAAVADLGYRVQGDSSDRSPKPMYLHDLSSGSINHYFTPGGKARLQGERLRFDKKDAAQGFFMVNGSHVEKLDESAIELIAAGVYDLVLSGQYGPGIYHLEVRSIPDSESGLLTGQLSFDLEVHDGQQSP